MTEVPIDFSKFADISYQSFQRRAEDQALSVHEKVGFPDAYREGREALILDDIAAKLSNLARRDQVVVDIGPGCGPLATLMMQRCASQGHRLFQVDSAEMLRLLPDAPRTTRIAGRFPAECLDFAAELRGRADCVLAYGVLSSVFADANGIEFVDHATALLAEGGQLLIGDVPNVSKRRRFFASEAGVRFHQEFMGTDERPSVEFNVLDIGSIDDALLLSLVARCRAGGFDAYLLAQRDELPFANRREDLLVVRP